MAAKVSWVPDAHNKSRIELFVTIEDCVKGK